MSRIIQTLMSDDIMQTSISNNETQTSSEQSQSVSSNIEEQSIGNIESFPEAVEESVNLVYTSDVEVNNAASAQVEDVIVEENLSYVIEKCITAIEDQSISDPVHMLRLLQSKIVTGRKLELTDENSTIEGKTNFILVDRENLLQTAFEEISCIGDLRFTLEVNFYGEIEEKYFQPVLGDVAAEDYVTVGKIHALSILQNGKLPVYDQEIMQEVFESKSPRPALLGLRRGLDSLGIFQIANSFKMFLHLLRPCNVRLTFRRLMSLLVADFNEVGSNKRKFENLVYTEFLTDVREVSSGRREGVSIHEVLQFITGADAEPTLGFGISPSISFVEYSSSFLPTANTCINRLLLPRPTNSVSLLKRNVLFEMYDLAFRNTYYGLM